MKYDRIFIFGCSFTKHQWPTWADVLRYNSDVPVENWGYGGIGNIGIFHRLVECDCKNKFTDRDLLLVQWSGWSREDRFRDDWVANGNVFNNPSYDRNFLEKHWHRNNDIIKNSTALIAAAKMFELDYQCHLIPLSVSECQISVTMDQNNGIYNFYQSNIDQTIDVFPLDKNGFFENKCMDTHPDIKNHILFYENFVRKKLDFLPEVKNKKKLLDLHYQISKSINKKMSFEKTMKTVISITENFDATLMQRPLGF